jgi:formylglycine-generating enzyme required for sulfatase activity/energy-coupling factor transporter ATP-binding protein EcfA2
MNDAQPSGIAIGSVGGDLSLQAGGDIVAGNKTIINNIIQHLAKELTATPYKFLASYEIADRDIFYGRDGVIEELAAQIGRHKVILINGASGSGKSSLVNAGLIPRVADSGYTFAEFREYSDPLAQLQSYFDTADSLPPQSPAKAADIQGSLLQLIRGFGAFPIVIFLDQFERFFVRVADDKRRAFIAAFCHCLQHSEAKDLCFVLVFCREFFGQLTSEFEEQIPAFLNEAYRINLLPLGQAEARQAVLRPLDNTALKIQYDEDFVDVVLLAGLAEQTGGGTSIDPPHLQIVCNQLFEAARQRLQTRSSVLINRALYDELGGAQNILNTYLDKVVEEVAQDPARIAVVHSILKTMIDAGTNTRTFVAMDGFKRALPDVNEAEILKLIEKLLDRRVVEERKSAYSLSHEHMVGKVKEWFDLRELERKRAEETLNRGMMEWKNSGALLNRGQIERIRKWLPDPAPAEVTAFVAASRRAALRNRRRRIATVAGAVVALPVIATLLWAGLVGWGVRAVEAEMEAEQEFVPIPAGCFEMGSPDTETERDPREGPVHEVCPKAFALSKFEVTQAEWRRVIGLMPDPSQNKGDRRPVESVSWNEAQFFISLMNLFGRHHYRMPSEAEWEYAARAGTTTARYWGDRAEDGCVYENMADLTLKKASPDAVVTNCDDSQILAAPVGSFKPNPWGLYDMLGNVAEWVEDCYVASYQEAPKDGRAIATQDCAHRIVRGGSWFFFPRLLRAANRFYLAPEDRGVSVGFRLARTIPP